MRLKTLKDLDLCCVSKDGDDTKCLFPQIKLKHEIIKWIKDMEAEQPYGKHTKSVIIWVMVFGNINKKDLKDGS